MQIGNLSGVKNVTEAKYILRRGCFSVYVPFRAAMYRFECLLSEIEK